MSVLSDGTFIRRMLYQQGEIWVALTRFHISHHNGWTSSVTSVEFAGPECCPGDDRFRTSVAVDGVRGMVLGYKCGK